MSSGITVESVRNGRHYESMVVTRLTSDDAREVVYALGLHDAAAHELLEAADRVDILNGVADEVKS